MTVSDARRRARVPLIEGRLMRCPRCRGRYDILKFVRLMQIQEFVTDTTPVYKCPRREGGCGFLFAPAESAVRESVTG